MPAQASLVFAGVQTPAVFSRSADELHALVNAAGIYDAGWRARLRITGEDRVRWLNGMVTNTVKDLRPGHGNYTFLLNAQGRIQGDGHVYALPDALLLATDHAQAPRLAEHLDRFIIMDDVELAQEKDVTAFGLAGPQAAVLLEEVLSAPPPPAGQFTAVGRGLVAQERPGQYLLWASAADAPALWQRFQAAGAVPCGIEAVEALRVLEGVPRYGSDIGEKTLAQETGQSRALNFNKGCYLGQEIVERIRSRATVHRSVRAFSLQGELPAPGTALFAPEKPEAAVGELTSVAQVELPGTQGLYALGTVRTEAALQPLAYAGGTATALPRAPLQAD